MPSRGSTTAQTGSLAAIAFSALAVFVLDIYTPLGVAVWILYLIPLTLTVLSSRPFSAVAIAMAATLFLVIGYFASPPGVNPATAQLNRGFGLVTIWLVALIAYHAIRNKVKVKQDEWQQSGQAALREKMVGELKLHELGENVLGFMTEYLHAEVGVLYMHGEGPMFHREATHALAPPDAAPVSFEAGTGLLGQAAKDRKITVVRNVPDGYLSTGSGLGRARPRNLLIIPTVTDGIVKSVIELGFFRPVDEPTVEFARRAAESIATAVRSAKYRAQLERLLHEKQLQAEELQQQSEELRVTNEELEEQGRMLKDAQARLEQQHAELEQSNSHLEDQARILEAQKEELMRAKTELEGRTRDLERASRYKSDFLSSMSHELRTPLNSSLILAKLLAENRTGNLTPDQVKYARTIHAAGNDLLLLINDVLDLAKVEAGRLDVMPRRIRLEEALEPVRNAFEMAAVEKGIKFTVRLEGVADVEIETDPQRLEQILRNLVSNAIKFTPNGEVEVTAKRVGNDEVAFAVRDTGIGISREDQQHIFEPFRQGSPGTDRLYGGTGLGLSISRQLVKLLQGTIELESDLGRGSTFTVRLPRLYRPTPSPSPSAAPIPPPTPSRPALPAASAGPRPAVEPPIDDRHRLDPQSRSLLIIEDDETFRGVMADLAHEVGFQVILAGTADEGLRNAARYRPGAIILDIGLPDTTGLSVLDRLKNDPATRHIPVHVISGTDHTQAAYSMGAVGYMLKPIEREELAHALGSLETRLARKVRRLLIVDDDPVLRESLHELLNAPGIEVVVAANAHECLDLLRASTFDCMVLDLTLPDTSGFALLETLSREDAYSFPPVIVYTGRELSRSEEEQLRRYAKSVIVKGAKSPERLLDEVTLFLHQVVSELPAERQRLLDKAKGRDAALEGRRILIAEDDVRNVFALTSVFEPRGAILTIARNGVEALAAVEAAAAAGKPIDLILMDVMMPEMDGIAATKELRKRPVSRKLPIIVLTAKATPKDQAECLAAGANDYIPKPLDVDKLLSLVRVWMPR